MKKELSAQELFRQFQKKQAEEQTQNTGMQQKNKTDMLMVIALFWLCIILTGLVVIVAIRGV